MGARFLTAPLVELPYTSTCLPSSDIYGKFLRKLFTGTHLGLTFQALKA